MSDGPEVEEIRQYFWDNFGEPTQRWFPTAEAGSHPFVRTKFLLDDDVELPRHTGHRYNPESLPAGSYQVYEWYGGASYVSLSLMNVETCERMHVTVGVAGGYTVDWRGARLVNK